jgi:hypothetical protein
MVHRGVSEVIGTALVDDGFRQALLQNPGKAVVPFNLASEEVYALSRIRAQTLEQFAEQVVTWLGEADDTGRL